MTDKEKEAIERLKLDITKPLYYREQTIVNVDDLETVLNLIQTQQEEIEHLKQEKATAWEEWNNIDQYCDQEK